MEYETLDDGTVLTDETVDKFVADTYTALDRGAWKVIPNPHNTNRRVAPRRVNGQQRAMLLEALSLRD